MCYPIPFSLEVRGDMNTKNKHFEKWGQKGRVVCPFGVMTWRGEICSSPLSRMGTGGWGFSCRVLLVARVSPAV